MKFSRHMLTMTLDVTERYRALCLNGDHDTPKARECLVPLHRRKMKAFFLRRQPNDCYDFEEINGKANFQVQLVESLVVQGEMETLLRICSHRNVHYHEWIEYRNCYCSASNHFIPNLVHKARANRYKELVQGLGRAVQHGPQSIHCA